VIVEEPPPVHLEVTAVSHRGLVREANEDAVGIDGWVLTGQEAGPLSLVLAPRPEGVTVAVADGMGGHRGGAEASRHALAVLLAMGADLREALWAAAEALRARSGEDPALRGMGTTVVGLRVLPDGNATVFNVGDSRAYRLVEGYLGQLSIDDRPAPATPENRGVVTQSLGGDRVVALDPHLHEVRLVPGDRLLLCSDGLHDMVPDDAIAECLRLPALEAAAALLTAALEAGGQDNVSLAVVDVHAGGGGAGDGE